MVIRDFLRSMKAHLAAHHSQASLTFTRASGLASFAHATTTTTTTAITATCSHHARSMRISIIPLQLQNKKKEAMNFAYYSLQLLRYEEIFRTRKSCC